MITDVTLFNWTIIVVIYFLLKASISDYTKHEVKNELWIQMLFVLSPIIAIWIYKDPLYIIIILKAFIITTSVGYCLFKIGLFGGADVKMLMALSIIFPENIYFIPLVLLISLCSIVPIGLIMIKINKSDKNVTIPFIPIISIVFFILLYFFRFKFTSF